MNAFWKHVSSVFAGTLLAQSIPIVGSLFITRIFAPSEFGEFSTWLALVSFVAVIVTLRFEAVLAIVEDGLARTEAVLIVMVTTVVAAAVMSVCLAVLKHLPWGPRHYLPEKTVLLVLLVPAALLMALNQVWQTWAAADGAYGKLNAMRIVQALATVLFQVGAGLKYPNALSLVLGFVLAGGIAFAWAVTLMPRFLRRGFFDLARFRKFFHRYRKFPLYALPADSINTAASQLPVLVVSYRFGNEVAGYLALTMRVLGAPVGLVGKAVLDVFKRYAVQSIKQIGNCRSLYVNTFMALALASLVMVMGTIFLAEDIFRVAFGPEWVPSGRMAIWLLPMFAMGLIASPLSYMTYLVEKQHIDMLWQFGLMVVTVGALYSFATYQSTLIGYGVGYAGMYLIYMFISYRLSGGVR